MYYILKSQNRFLCSVQIQDGTERWEAKNLDEAIHSVIRAARTLNHDYINKDDITIMEEPVQQFVMDGEEQVLLREIKCGAKVVLNHDHYLLKYRISQEEADMLIAIREGRATVRNNG